MNVKQIRDYLRATLTESDLRELNESGVDRCAEEAATIRGQFPWSTVLPEELFLRAVAFPRVNTEELRDGRSFLRQLLLEEIPNFESFLKRKPTPTLVQDLVLAVNVALAKHAEYRSTDGRTSAAMATFLRGYGRCGEESVLFIEALRSMGIAARQVYVPLWAHCDDNHAWVEYYDGEDWHFTGALEPDASLDHGWFNSAAARAPLALARLPYDSKDCIGVQKGMGLINVTERYAATNELTLQLSKRGRVFANGKIQLNLINDGRCDPLVSLKTDDFGRTKILPGLADVLLSVEGHPGVILIPAGTEHFECDLTDLDRSWTGLLRAPMARTVRVVEKAEAQLTEEIQKMTATQRKEGFAAVATEAQVAVTRFATQYELRALSAAELERIGTLLYSSGRNYTELLSALGQSAKRNGLKLALALAEALDHKRRSDSGSEALCDSWLRTEIVGSFDENTQPEALLRYKPDVDLEPLSPWRETVDVLTERLELAATDSLGVQEKKLKAKFTFNAESHLQSIAVTAREMAGSVQDFAILKVAVARFLGLNAYLSKEDGRVKLWRSELPGIPESRKDASLCISASVDFLQEYRLSLRSRSGVFDLELVNNQNASIECSLDAGAYRLVASKRLLSGDVVGLIRDLDLKKNEQMHLELKAPQIEEPESAFPLLEAEFTTESGEKILLSEASPLLIILERGGEPSAHIRQELRALTANERAKIVLVQTEAERENLGLKVLRAGGHFADALARQVFLEPGILPLIVVHRGLTAHFASSGYRPQVLELALRSIKD